MIEPCFGWSMTSMGINWEQNGKTLSSAPVDMYWATTSGMAWLFTRQRGNLKTGTPSLSASVAAGQNNHQTLQLHCYQNYKMYYMMMYYMTIIMVIIKMVLQHNSTSCSVANPKIDVLLSWCTDDSTHVSPHVGIKSKKCAALFSVFSVFKLMM